MSRRASFPEDDIRHLQPYMEITKSCRKCNGTGVYLCRREASDGSEEIELKDCSCIFDRLVEYRLDKANVKPRYRDFTLEKLTSEFRELNPDVIELVDEFLSDVSTHINSGHGMYFEGPWGAAKSAIAAVIARKAVESGFQAYTIRVPRLLELYMQAMSDPYKREVVDSILSSEIRLLILEEIDKLSLDPENGGPGERQRYEALMDMVGEIYESDRSLIVTSNRPLRTVTIERDGRTVSISGLDDVPCFRGSFGGHVIDRLDVLEPVTIDMPKSFRTNERWRTHGHR